MNIRSTRGRAVLGGATFAVGLCAASVASACVPNIIYDKFDIREPTPGSTTVVRSAKTGDQLRAVGRGIDLATGHPYQVKLLVEDFAAAANVNGVPQPTLAEKRACGDRGVLQAIAPTSPWVSQYNVPPQRFSGTFDVPFVLTMDAQVEPGPAHFCALAGGNKEVSDAMMALEMYIFEPFNFTVV